MADKKLLTTVGVFAGILKISDESAELLLRLRVEEDSIIPGQSYKGNWELPGGGAMEQDEEIPYDYLLRELTREVQEEVGIGLDLNLLTAQPFYAFPFKGPKGYDLALVTTMLLKDVPQLDADKFRWVTIDDLNQLARDFVAAKRAPLTEGKGLLSGWGKRMHCMALSSFLTGIVPIVMRQKAIDTLSEIRQTW